MHSVVPLVAAILKGDFEVQRIQRTTADILCLAPAAKGEGLLVVDGDGLASSA